MTEELSEKIEDVTDLVTTCVDGLTMHVTDVHFILACSAIEKIVRKVKNNNDQDISNIVKEGISNSPTSVKRLVGIILEYSIKQDGNDLKYSNLRNLY